MVGDGTHRGSEKDDEAVQQRLRATLDATHDAIYWLAPMFDGAGTLVDFRFLDVNPAGEEELGRAASELVGRGICELYPVNRESGFFDQYRRVFETGVALDRQYEVPPGHDAPGHYRQRVVRLADGLVIFNRNVTEENRQERDRKRLEEDLRQSQKMEALGRLAGGTAHDFNNVLATILAAAEVLEHRVAHDPESRTVVRDIARAAEQAGSFVKDILTFSRRAKLERQPVRLSNVVRRAVRMLERMLPRSIRVLSRIEPELVVEGDAGQLEQVVVNLVTNAWHAIGNSVGTIGVSLRTGEAHQRLDDGRLVAELCVVDNGPGMTAEVRERVFEPFFTTKKPGEGTGLGLSVVHGIVGAHGGDMELVSEPDQGTTVRVLLPLAEGSGRPRSWPVTGEWLVAQDDPAATPEERPRVVLLVDDEAPLCGLLARVLRGSGFVVLEATNVDDALSLARSAVDRLGAAVLDYNMPGMTGLELGAQLRRMLPSLPIVLLTGGGLDVDPEAEEVHTVLVKPVRGRSLVRVLSELFPRAPHRTS